MASTRHKLRRKDLRQPDEFMTVAYTVEEFVRQHLDRVIYGAAAILIIAAAGFGLYRYRVNINQKAAEQFYEGFSALDSKDFKTAEGKFEKLIADYPKSGPGRMARFYLGVAYLNSGDPGHARGALEEYVKNPSGQAFHEMALMDLAVVYEQSGDIGRSVQSYKEAAALGGPQSANAKLAVARLLEVQGKRDAAIEAYRDFLKANPYSSQRQAVVEALAGLGVSAPGPELSSTSP